MNSAIERLVGLRVKDVMNKQVMSILETDDMKEAAKKLYEHDVTGAPVVDAFGACVGVLSARDYVDWDAGHHNSEILTKNGPNEPYRIECMDDELVSTHMSPLVQTVSAEAPILQAARVMCDEGIHRLVVVDEFDRPIGIVSTLDLTASMVAAIEEP